MTAYKDLSVEELQSLKSELEKEIQADTELLERLFAIVDNVNMN